MEQSLGNTNEPPLLIVRADADSRLGIGHVMRCLALAHAWQAAGGRVTFVSHCPIGRLRERIRASGAELVCLDDRHPHPADLDTTLDTIAQSADAGWTVLDGMHFDAAYRQSIRRESRRLLVIDDMAPVERFEADVLLNQNLAAEELGYDCCPETVLLLGCRYALLRPEFQATRSLHRENPEIAARLLVTAGGADPDNVTAMVLAALDRLDLPGMEVKVAIGSANPNLASIRGQIESAPATAANVQLLTDVADMSGLMAWADVAVSAAGSTCWELAVMGLPAVLFVLSDNQQPIADRLAEAGVATSIGRGRELGPREIAAAIEALCRDRSRRAAQSEAGRRLLDGNGAQRVAAVMRALDGQLPPDRVELRPIGDDDVLPLWRLANDPAVRANSLSTDPIPLAEHRAWFRGKLASPATRIWVLDFQGVILAVIRYDRTDPDVAEISFSVVAAFRQRGLGSRLIDETCGRACRELRTSVVRAVVREANLASAKTFVKTAFALVDSRIVRGHPCRIFERTHNPRPSKER